MTGLPDEGSIERVVFDVLVERAAAAIFEVRDDESDLRTWAEAESDERERYQCDARAALAAVLTTTSHLTPSTLVAEVRKIAATLTSPAQITTLLYAADRIAEQEASA